LSERFPKSRRLLRPQEFQRVFAQGSKVSGRLVQLLYLPNSLESTRLGVAVGKRLGRAVRRNLLKRRIREALRRQQAIIQTGLDIVVFPKTQASIVDFPSLSADLLDLFSHLKNKRKVGNYQESRPDQS
jgi:ribonuclease P protein component